MKIYLLAAVLLVLSLLAVYFIVVNKSHKEPIQSVAVLPFENLSGEPDQEFLSEGFAEGVLNALARREGIKVSARTSSFQFRGTTPSLEEIAEKLGVRAVLEGSVLREGDRILITVQLVDADAELHLWSERYHRKIENIFALQDEIANNIAEALLPGSHAMVTKNTTNGEAYELYLRGRSSWNRRTPADLQEGIKLFQQAIERDPGFGASYAGLADCYTALGYGSFEAPKDAFPKAYEAASKALTLDSTLAEAHATLGYYQFYYEWDWAEAEKEFRKAILLNPNNELCYDWYGYYLTAMQRYDDAKVVMARAGSLDPLSAPIGTDMGFSLYYGKEYDRASEALKSALRLNPKFALGHLWLGRTYQAKKMYSQAVKEYEKALAVTGTWPVAFAQIGNAYGVSGNVREARIVLDSLNAFSSRKYVTSYGVALVYAGIGENDEAFKWLDKAFEERSHWLVWLKTDPRWENMRSDKRFAELLSRIGMPQIAE